MNSMPKWFRPAAAAGLVWNLIGCAAYLADVRLSPEDIAGLREAQQAVYAARPPWAVAATATAVWVGALGCLGLFFRQRWAYAALWVSLLGVIAQDLAIFVISSAGAAAGAGAVMLQAVVLLVSIGLVVLARHGREQGWLN